MIGLENKTDSITPSLMLKKNTISDDLLYVGIDVGKKSCVAGFVSTTLLSRHGEFINCPAIAFDQSLTGFENSLIKLSFMFHSNKHLFSLRKQGTIIIY